MLLRLMLRFVLASALFASSAGEALALNHSAETSSASDTGQADEVQLDGEMVPLPALPMEESTEESTDEESTPAPDAGASVRGTAEQPVAFPVPVVDRETRIQERAARRLAELPVSPPPQAPPPPPVHAAAPPPPPRLPAGRQGSVSAQVQSNPLPPTGTAHVAILVASALITGGSFLSHRWATKKI